MVVNVSNNSEDKEEASVDEEDKVVNQYSIKPVEYSETIRGSALMRSVHTMRPTNIILKITLS